MDESIKIDFDDINQIKVDNIVNYGSGVYTIYDIEDNILYLKNPDNENIGVPITSIRPILLSDKIMELCGFEIEYEPELKERNGNVIQSKTSYRIINTELGIDMSVVIIIDYEWDSNEMFLIDTLDKLDKKSKKIKWLHQLQNVFKSIYGIELITIN